MSKNTVKSIMEALGVLRSADPAVVSALADDADIAKSLGQTAEKLTPSQHVKDRWLEGETHKSPTREELKIGPSQEASGGGAEKMIDDYSNPARQTHGIEQVAERLGAMFEGFGRAAKAILDSNAQTNTLLKAILVKAAEDEEEDDEEEDEEESEVVEINASRGKSYFGKAKKLFAKAAALKAEMEDEDDKDKKKACKAEIKALTKSATQLLVKARTAAYAAKSKELKKSIRELAVANALSKADINVVQEEEEDEEEEEEEEGEGKSKKSAADLAELINKAVADALSAAGVKAKTDDKGNQADRAEPDSGNQAHAAKSAEEIAALSADVKKALDGLGTLQMNLNGMMDTISGKSKLPSPAIAKAEIDVPSIQAQIMDMEDGGMLSAPDAMAARDIAGKIELVKGGKLDAAVVTDRLAKTSTAVKMLFQAAKSA